MKKLIFICLFFPCLILNAQNSLFIALQPCDAGIGLRYDFQPKEYGFYAALTHGNYRLGKSYVDDHLKMSTGFLYKSYSVGVNYHQYGKIVGEYPKNTFKPISLELGCKIELGRFCTGLRFDPIKFEGTWDVGFNF